MSKYGPDRRELYLRLSLSLFGLALLIGGYATGAIGGLGSLEIAIVGGGALAGFALWSIWRLRKGPDP